MLKKDRSLNIVCVVPARGGSKGIKDKNIVSLAGKPLMAYTLEAALDSRLANRVVVSTDNKKIARVAREYGVSVIKRPKEYATDTAPIEWALIHAVEYLAAHEGYLADIVVWLHANVPVRKKGQIDRVIRSLIAKDADSAVSVYEVSQFPQWMKKMDKNSFLHPFVPGCKVYRRQDLEPSYLLDGAIVAMQKESLLASKGRSGQHVYLGKKVLGIVEDWPYTIEVDDQKGLDLANLYLSLKKHKR